MFDSYASNHEVHMCGIMETRMAAAGTLLGCYRVIMNHHTGG